MDILLNIRILLNANLREYQVVKNNFFYEFHNKCDIPSKMISL